MDIGRDLLLRNSECFNTVSLCCLATQFPSAWKQYSVKELGTCRPLGLIPSTSKPKVWERFQLSFWLTLKLNHLQIIFESSFYPYMMSLLPQPKQIGRHLNTIPLLKYIPTLSSCTKYSTLRVDLPCFQSPTEENLEQFNLLILTKYESTKYPL